MQSNRPSVAKLALLTLVVIVALGSHRVVQATSALTVDSLDVPNDIVVDAGESFTFDLIVTNQAGFGGFGQTGLAAYDLEIQVDGSVLSISDASSLTSLDPGNRGTPTNFKSTAFSITAEVGTFTLLTYTAVAANNPGATSNLTIVVTNYGDQDGEEIPIGTDTTRPKTIVATGRVRINAPQADLSVTKGALPNPVVAGSTVTYTVTVANAGPSAATGLTLIDTLPSGVSFVTSTGGTACTESVGVVTCSLIDLGVDATISVELLADVGSLTTGTITNTVSVSSVEDDPNPSNNTATATTTVNVEWDVPLLPGYNLIGIPIRFGAPFLARDLAEALLPVGVNIEDGPVTAVLSWTGGGYLPWLSNNPLANNFEIERGKGYFVRLQSAVPGDKLTVTGLP